MKIVLPEETKTAVRETALVGCRGSRRFSGFYNVEVGNAVAVLSDVAAKPIVCFGWAVELLDCFPYQFSGFSAVSAFTIHFVFAIFVSSCRLLFSLSVITYYHTIRHYASG